MQKILTVSVASYDVEKYINEALSSIADCTFLELLEVFVVDDGGKDGTLKIAQRYAQKYPRSFFAVHKENGGYGSTVNYSIAHATGKYFKLLDGDDRFSTSALDDLVRFLSAYDADVVYMPYLENNGGRLKKIDVGSADVTSFEAWHGQTALLTMHALCFKTAVLKGMGLTLPERCLYTDSYFSIRAFSGVKTALYFPHAVYVYRLGRNGQSMSRQSRIRHYDDMERILFGLIDCCNASGVNADYMRACTASHACMTLKVLLLGVKDGLKKIKFLEKRLKNADVDIYDRMACTGKTGKLISLLRKTNYGAYHLIRLLPKGVFR